MNINKIFKNERAFKATTGMGVSEFKVLVPTFERELLFHYSNQPNRKRKPGGGKKGYLRNPAEKLFFILFYLKTYPTFDVLGFFFDKGRGRSCEAVHLYLAILEKTLGKKFQLPKRKISSVEEFFEKFPEVKDVFIDGTERRIQRPMKDKRNRRQYSGKKKGHTRKNIVLVNDKKRILAISPTKPGRRHDKNCTDRILLTKNIPEHVTVWGDSAFQGIENQHKNSLVAKRAHKNHPLSPEEKKENHVISSFRVIVEHALGGMKRYRIVSDVLRNKIGIFDDRLAVVTAGLWNYHLASTV